MYGGHQDSPKLDPRPDEIIRDRDRCKQCNGKKTIVDRKVLHVHVDKGVRSGTRVDFKGEGDQAWLRLR